MAAVGGTLVFGGAVAAVVIIARLRSRTQSGWRCWCVRGQHRVPMEDPGAPVQTRLLGGEGRTGWWAQWRATGRPPVTTLLSGPAAVAPSQPMFAAAGMPSGHTAPHARALSMSSTSGYGTGDDDDDDAGARLRFQ